MAYMSINDFNALQSKKQNNFKGDAPKSKVGFFKIEDDGGEAIVRFAYSDPSQFEVYTVHPVNIEGKFRKVNCLKDITNPDPNSCPLCAAGVQLQQKFYIKLIEYVRNEDGTISAVPKIWERPTKYVQMLSNLFTEYGDISECVFKVKRSGAKGDMQTTYNIMFGNPSVYNSQLYPKDFSAFDDYKVIGTAVLDKTPTELGVVAREMTGNVTPTASFNQPVQAPVSDTLPFGNQQTYYQPEQNVVLTTPRKVQY